MSLKCCINHADSPFWISPDFSFQHFSISAFQRLASSFRFGFKSVFIRVHPWLKFGWVVQVSGLILSGNIS